MGLYQPKSFKRLNRITGKWELVIPALTDLKKELFKKKSMNHVTEFLKA